MDECPKRFQTSEREARKPLGVLPTLENLLKNTESFQPSEVYEVGDTI